MAATVSAGVAVVATERKVIPPKPDPQGSSGAGASALLAAALALPGIVPATASAQTTAPDAGFIALKYLDYRDWQPGANRMMVRSPSLYVQKRLSESLAVEGSLVYDSMSGASPLFFNTLSGASGLGITDYRTAGDVKLTRYFDHLAVGVAAAVSSERDYLSRAFGLDVRYSTDDNNTTLAFGIGGADDTIDSVNGLAENQKRYSLEYLAGVTQALSPTAIVQSNLTYYRGHGYYSDPYKPLDRRPDYRRIFAWLTRYNQMLPAYDATLQLSYRFLNDSFGFDSNMLEAAWVQSLPAGWSVTPAIRYYTQGAADFYHNPPFPAGFVRGQDYTADARLSAFGAFTGSLWVQKVLPDGWGADLKIAFYRQRAAWRLGGDGSPGLDPFSARWIQAGISRTF